MQGRAWAKTLLAVVAAALVACRPFFDALASAGIVIPDNVVDVLSTLGAGLIAGAAYVARSPRDTT